MAAAGGATGARTREPGRTAWAMLGLLAFARMCMALQLQAIPPVTPFLIADLGLNYTEVGVLIGLFLLPGFFLALPGGVLARRVGDKRLQEASLLLLVAGAVLLGLADTFAQAFAGRLLAGVGAVTLTVQQPKMVTDWFPGRGAALAMAVLVASYPVGLALALGTLGGLAALTSWRVSMFAIAGVTACALAAVWAGYRSPPGAAPPTSPTDGGRPWAALWGMTRRETVLAAAAGLLWMLLNTGFIVYMSFVPLLLIERGFGVAAAGALTSVASWLSLLSVPLGGYLAERTGRKRGLIVLASLAAAATTAGLPGGALPALWVAAFGLVRGLGSGAIMSLPGDVLRPAARSMGFALYFTVYYVGMSVLPPVAGWLQDAAGTADAAVLFSALLWALITPALLLFVVLQARWAPGRA